MSHDVYVAVKRTIDGVECRTIERMSPDESVCYFDCAVVYEGAAASVITGLWHLEGETVDVLADGGWHDQCTVSGGSITLDGTYTSVVIGYAHTEEVQTLPQILERYPAFGIGAKKNVNGVFIRVSGESGIEVGPTGGNLIDYTLRGNDLMTGTPAQQESELIEVPLLPDWQDDCSVTIRNSSGRPIVIISAAYDLEASG